MYGTPDFPGVTQHSGNFHCKITLSENKSEACGSAELSEFISEFIPNYLLGLRFYEAYLDLFLSFKMSTLKASKLHDRKVFALSTGS